MNKKKAIPENFMTVGGLQKKWGQQYEHFNIMTKRVCF